MSIFELDLNAFYFVLMDLTLIVGISLYMLALQEMKDDDE